MQQDELKKFFVHHPPKGNQAARYEMIRELALAMATAINELVPTCADQTAAIRKVREAMMTANAGIACNE